MASDYPDRKISEGDGYLLRHWRGEFNLFQSFWGNYGAFYAFLTVVSLLIARIFGEWSFRGWAAFLAFAQTVNIIAFAWMAVGNWRAAGIHMRGTGRLFWPLTARGILIAHAAALGIVVLPNLPLNFQIGAGIDAFDAFKIVRTGSRELLFQGELGAKVPGEVSEALRAAPEIEWIRLESDGGWIGAARELANLISARDLKARVWDECSSACFVAFMAADVRAISPKAQIGLHGYYWVAGIELGTGFVMSDDRRYLIARGVSEALLDKAFSTPSDDMWYPSFEELVEAGVVTHVMEDGEIRPVHPQ